MNHILLCTTSFPDSAFQDGQEAAGSFVADFALVLSKVVSVTVVAPSLQNGIEQHGNLKIHRFAVPSLPLSLLTPKNPAKWGEIIQTLRAGRKAMQEVVNTEPVDHIFALWALPSGWWARSLSRQTGIPYSIWALGSDIWGVGQVPMIKSVLRNVLRDAHHRFADGYLLAADTEKIGGVPCTFLPSTRRLIVPQAKALASTPPYKLAFLGRWHPNKGADLLIEALAELDDSDWASIEAVRVCGGGPLEEVVHAGVDRLVSAGRPISRSGYLDQVEATALYCWADYLMIPSRIESIPVIFSDAMQADCPIIAMPTGDLPHLDERFRVGVIASEISADAFATAIRSALQTAPDRFTIGLKEACAAFDIDQSVHTFLEKCQE